MDKLSRLLPCLLVVLVLPAVAAQEGGQDELWRAIRDDRAVALMRHAYAPGVGDPEDFRIDDCSTQRNLSVEGEIEVRGIADRFRAHGIEDADVYSSQWCRCLGTAELLELGPVVPMPALNSFFGDRSAAPAQTAEMKDFLATRQSARPLVLVTHQVNITALADVVSGSGEIVVVETGADGRLEVLGRIPPPG